MPDRVEPPEGLREIVAEAIEKATWMTAVRHEDLADAVLAALFEACEVREETEWAVQHKLDGGNVNTSNPFYRREHAEWRTWGFHFGQQEPGVVVRRRIWAGPWSPVLSDNSSEEG